MPLLLRQMVQHKQSGEASSLRTITKEVFDVVLSIMPYSRIDLEIARVHLGPWFVALQIAIQRVFQLPKVGANVTIPSLQNPATSRFIVVGLL